MNDAKKEISLDWWTICPKNVYVSLSDDKTLLHSSVEISQRTKLNFRFFSLQKLNEENASWWFRRFPQKVITCDFLISPQKTKRRKELFLHGSWLKLELGAIYTAIEQGSRPRFQEVLLEFAILTKGGAWFVLTSTIKCLEKITNLYHNCSFRISENKDWRRWFGRTEVQLSGIRKCDHSGKQRGVNARLNFQKRAFYNHDSYPSFQENKMLIIETFTAKKMQLVLLHPDLLAFCSPGSLCEFHPKFCSGSFVRIGRLNKFTKTDKRDWVDGASPSKIGLSKFSVSHRLSKRQEVEPCAYLFCKAVWVLLFTQLKYWPSLSTSCLR